MNKVFIAFLLATASLNTNAQINKGQWLTGGSATFVTGKFGDVDASKFTSFTLSPNAGYFFADKFAGGLRLSVQSTKQKEEESISNVLVAPFVRYYFLPTAQKVNLFADAAYGFGSMKDGESEGFNQFTIAAGPAVFLSPNTALEFTLQYSSAGGDAYGGDDRQNNFGINVGFQIHLGGAK